MDSLPPDQNGNSNSPASEGTRALPGPLRIFAVIATLVMAASWTIALLFPVDPMRWYLTKGMWPRYDDWFADLYHYDTTFSYLHTTAFFTCLERFAYPAPSAVPYFLFREAGSYRLVAFLVLAMWVAIVAALLFARALVRSGVSRAGAGIFALTVLLTSWPLLFLIERANIELVVLCFTLGGSLAYWRGHTRWAAVLWGLAASMKIYPVLLLALFLKRRHLGTLALGLLSFATSLLLSFWWVGPTIPIAAVGSVHGITGFVSTYAYQARIEIGYDHSFLAAIKSPLAIHRLHIGPKAMGLIGHLYVYAVLLSACVAYLIRVRHLPQFNRFAVFSIAMIALPPVSYDYTLCHLYAAFALTTLVLVRGLGSGRVPPGPRPLFWCFLVLFTSQTVVFYQTVHPNGVIKAVTLLTALVLLIRYPIRDELIAAVLTPGAVRGNPGDDAPGGRAGRS